MIHFLQSAGKKSRPAPVVLLAMCLLLALTACASQAAASSLALVQSQAVQATNSSTPTASEAVSATAGQPDLSMPDPSLVHWAVVARGIKQPTAIQTARDGSGRLFLLERPGRILIRKNGKLLSTPFLDITGRVGSHGGEQGLLGLAFHPHFSQNGYFYVNYTDLSGNTHIARFTANGDVANPASEKLVLFVKQPFANHNGGNLSFGPDGFLYIGLGDGGSGGDPFGNAQSTQTLLGKLLRIDVDHGNPYAIPPGNPFAINGKGNKEIWDYGLRNPWRFSFDTLTGDLWIGDVGQNLWEEVDFAPAGKTGGLNFGWNKMEGNHPYKGTNQPGFTAPVAEYPHGAECSVTGGYVYRGRALPLWSGIYLYGDYCSGAIWGLPTPPYGATPKLLFQTGFRISTFGVDGYGELYVADYATGTIYKLVKN